jgi:uncharacterized membrane protein YecN with MAPEG domain
MATPITALWAGLLGILSLALAMNVVRGRVSENVIFGDGGVTILQQRIRVHGNFVEYVPIALVLLLVLELNGTSPLVLNVLGGGLFVGRLLHAFGLATTTGTSAGRFIGTIVTWLAILAASGLALWRYFA